MHKKFEINQTKIKGSCQSGRKVVTHNFKKSGTVMLRRPGKKAITVKVARYEHFF